MSDNSKKPNEEILKDYLESNIALTELQDKFKVLELMLGFDQNFDMTRSEYVLNYIDFVVSALSRAELVEGVIVLDELDLGDFTDLIVELDRHVASLSNQLKSLN